MPTRRHVLISYAILVGALSVVLLALLQPPLAQRIAFFSRLESVRLQYAMSAAAIASSERIRDEIEARRLEHSGSPALFIADTAALAAADLQERLKALIESDDSVLLSSTFRRRSEALPLTPVTVVVRLRCSVAALVEILQSLESHEPVLFVDNLSIQSGHRPGRAVAQLADELDVELDVTGYLDRVADR